MITLCNNAHLFFEKSEGQIIIYGAGNSGDWIGKYMDRCGMEYLCYIDQQVGNDEYYLNNKPVYSNKKLANFAGQSLRIIVSPHSYGEIVTELMFLQQKIDINAICFVPRFYHFIERKEIYHINKLLSYFRRKLYQGSIPTIICNDCIGGEIYDSMDMIMQSPTINTWIEPDDFVKLCANPHKYLDIDAKETFKNIVPTKDKRAPMVTTATRIDDITVNFTHISENDNVIERWNTMRKRINWDNMIFVFRSYELPIPSELEKLARQADCKYLFIRISGNTMVKSDVDYLVLENNIFSDYGRAIDNVFDLAGWMIETCK